MTRVSEYIILVRYKDADAITLNPDILIMYSLY